MGSAAAVLGKKTYFFCLYTKTYFFCLYTQTPFFAETWRNRFCIPLPTSLFYGQTVFYNGTQKGPGQRVVANERIKFGNLPGERKAAF